MNITYETTGTLTATIRIELMPEDYQEKVTKKLKDYRQKANMPGFRPGMVPMGLINKMYGKAILVEEVTQMLNDHLTDYINDKEIHTLGSPLANEEKTVKPDWENPGVFDFSFDIGLSPEFEPELNSETEVEYLKIGIEEEQLGKEIESIRKAYGTFEPIDIAGYDDWLTVDMHELDADGNVLEGGISHSRRVTWGTFDDEDLKARLTGLKAGDTITFNPGTSINDPIRIGYLLNISKEETDGISDTFRMTVTGVERLTPSEEGPELFAKVIPGKTIETMEEFRNELKADMESSFEREVEGNFYANVRKKLLEKYQPELPEEFLKRWIRERQEEDHDHEDEHHHDHDHPKEEPDYQSIFEGMRWQLIENRIIRKYDLRVEMADVKAFVKERYRMYFGKQGALPQDAEAEENTLNMLADKYIEKKEDTEQIVDLLYNARLINLFREKLDIRIREVSHDDFHQITETHHH